MTAFRATGTAAGAPIFFPPGERFFVAAVNREHVRYNRMLEAQGYYRPGFHPWQLDDRHLIEDWRREYESRADWTGAPASQ